MDQKTIGVYKKSLNDILEKYIYIVGYYSTNEFMVYFAVLKADS